MLDTLIPTLPSEFQKLAIVRNSKLWIMQEAATTMQNCYQGHLLHIMWHGYKATKHMRDHGRHEQLRGNLGVQLLVLL